MSLKSVISEIISKRDLIFYVALILFVISIPFSEAFTSITIGIIFLQSILFGYWNIKRITKVSIRNILLINSLFLVYILGMFFTKDFSFGLYELRKVLFWIIAPVAIGTGMKLKEKYFWNLLIIFCISVILSSFISFGRLLFDSSVSPNNIREITFVSHIRFSFQIILAMIILSYLFIYNSLIVPKYILVISFLWLLFFLIIQKSILGIIAFGGTSLCVIIWLIWKSKNIFKRIFFLLLFIIIIIIPTFYVYRVVYDFYDVEKIDPNNIEKYTSEGNLYSFDFEDKAKENGYYVNVYICEEELREEWNKRSKYKYDDIANGYPIKSTIIRYLTSKGFRKDAEGINQLTEKDIINIELGRANYIFENQSFSIYPRIYETVWEIDNYMRTGNPNKQSLSQRIEFIRASLFLISKNPIFGIGTGNWRIDYANAYKEMGSNLSPVNYGSAHNQYLNYIVKFGIVGFLWIMFAVFFPFFKGGHYRNYIFVFFIVSILFVNFGDSNWESHMGLSFFSFFYCLFLWHSPKSLHESINLK